MERGMEMGGREIEGETERGRDRGIGGEVGGGAGDDGEKVN